MLEQRFSFSLRKNGRLVFLNEPLLLSYRVTAIELVCQPTILILGLRADAHEGLYGWDWTFL